MTIRAYLRERFVDKLSHYPNLKRKLKETEMTVEMVRHSAARTFPALIRPAPRNLTIAITAHCNLRCIGCRYGRDFMTGEQLPWPIVKDLLTDARALGFESVRLYGGEPLLHKDLPLMIEHSIALGLKVYVTTNGILLGEKIDELYRAGLRDVTIGFYGVGASYDEYVQRENRFVRLEASLGRIREKYGETISVRLNWLLMKPSCDLEALHKACDFAQYYSTPIQVDLIHYSLPYFTEGPDRMLQFQSEDREKIDLVVKELLRLKRESPRMFDQSEAGLASIPDWLLKGPDMRIPCDKYQMIWAGADGTVQLCYVTFKLGNLHEKRLTEMLFGPAHRQAALDAFAVRCPNCHCSYDARIQKHLPSRRLYSTR